MRPLTPAPPGHRTKAGSSRQCNRRRPFHTLQGFRSGWVRSLTRFAALTGSATARVPREGCIALALLQVAATGSGLESGRATAYSSCDNGESNEKERRLHHGQWYWLPSPSPSTLLFIHPPLEAMVTAWISVSAQRGITECAQRMITNIEANADEIALR
jgi:hypothetical protein